MTLRPGQGLIARLDHAGVPVLRPMADNRDSPLDAACFPLVPYANRIAGGCFNIQGREHRLPLNFGDHAHSLHGLGWQSRWSVASAVSNKVGLIHSHDGGSGWPWRYRAEQRLVLSERGLDARLSIVNEDGEPMPFGLGFHPYFLSGPATRLQFHADRMWHHDEAMLPTHPVRADIFGDWASGAPASADTLIDNAYESWNGTAQIKHADGRSFSLCSPDATWLHLYRPADTLFFCAEPVTHGPDAINRGGMPMLAPSEERSLTMTIYLD